MVDGEKVRGHADEVVRSTVETTWNPLLLDEEADRIAGAGRYERSAERQDTRAGSYRRKLQTKAGEVELTVPRLPRIPLEMAIIDRYRRRESSVEEALIEMYLAGVSMRRVEDITEALWGTRVRVGETLTYMNFPREHWRCIRTNNPMDRLNREVRRRTRVVGAFPDGQSALMLVAARLRHVAGTKWGARRYLDMRRLREMRVDRMEMMQAAVA